MTSTLQLKSGVVSVVSNTNPPVNSNSEFGGNRAPSSRTVPCVRTRETDSCGIISAGEKRHRSAGNVWITSWPARSMILTLGSRNVSPRSGVVHANSRSTTRRVSFSYGPAVVPSSASMSQSWTIRWILLDVHESVRKSHVKESGEVRMFEAS